MQNILYIPSIYAHIFNGLLLLFAILLVYRHYKNIQKIDSYKMIILVLLFSLSVGVHGLSHLGLETIYKFNPIDVLNN